MFNDADFDVLRTEGTFWLKLVELCIPRGNPLPVELELRYAGESNDAYQSELRSNAFRALIRRDADAAKDKLLAETVIVGWRNVFDGGRPVEFTVETCKSFLAQLRRVKRSALIDAIENVASSPTNFKAPLLDAGDLGNA